MLNESGPLESVCSLLYSVHHKVTGKGAQVGRFQGTDQLRLGWTCSLDVELLSASLGPMLLAVEALSLFTPTRD